MKNIIPVRAFSDNYIWMLLDDNNQVWAVDPGDSRPVIDFIRQHEYRLAGIFLTHHHLDHSGGIAELVAYAGNIPVVGSHRSQIKSINHFVQTGSQIESASFSLQTIEIPGHTLDHVAYYNNEVLFCGDTLFSAGCGRIFEGTVEMMYASLQLLLQLGDNIKVYCGHEYTLNNLLFAQMVEANNVYLTDRIEQVRKMPSENDCTLPSTLGEEKRINPFLRCREPEVVHSAELHAGRKLATEVEVFGCLREWKNAGTDARRSRRL
jgi:hydroxyacylglutathione hydrolase